MSSIIKVDTIQLADGTAGTIENLGLATGALSHRNLIINGAMNVAQRGTSSSVGNSSVYVLDRFVSEAESSGMTVSQEVEAPSGFKYSLKCLNGTGSASSGSEATYIRQFIEGYNVRQLAIGTSDAKTVTLSFWVRSSITGTYIVSFLDSGNDNGYPASYTIDTADTWEHKTITLTMSTYSGWVGNSTNGRGLVVHWDLGSGSDRDATTVNAWNDGIVNDWTHSSQTDWVATTGATFYLTGVQLEVGSVATPFEHRSYGEELARCQRYFQQFGRTSNNGLRILGMIRNGHGFFFKDLIVPMRTTPSATFYGSNSTTGNINIAFGSGSLTTVPSSWYLSYADFQGVSFRRDSLGTGTNGDSIYLDGGANTNQIGVHFDAEL